METRRSDNSSPTKDAFLGLYLSSGLKRRIEREAEELGVSISELARRRLRGDDQAAKKTAATT